MALFTVLADVTQVAVAAQSHSGSSFSFPVAVSMLSFTVAVCAFIVAARNFYLSRYQHVCCTFTTYTHTPAGADRGETVFDVEVESWGLPIWDMKVFIEAEYRNEFGVGWHTYRLELKPVASLPNPMNAGQVTKFRALKGEMQLGDERHKFARTRGLSDLPADRVLIRVYGSAERLIREYTRGSFGYSFVSFDSFNKDAAREQANQFDTRMKRAIYWLRLRCRRKPNPGEIPPSRLEMTRVNPPKKDS